MEKQLIIHIGSPKTGSTSIQGFLKTNPDTLKSLGINYVKAGRTNIAHNSMRSSFRRGKGPKVCAQIKQEIESSDKPVQILSSELFFTPVMAEPLANGLPEHMRKSVKILCYIRRQDKYLEALYKQFVKNGRIAPDPLEFYENRLESLAYSQTLDAFADQFGTENIIVRPYERHHFTNGDVVEDFMGHTGAPLPDGVDRAADSNRTLSIEVSEILGVISKETPRNVRHLMRELIRLNQDGTIRSNDVYDLPTRRSVMDLVAKDNEAVRERYCPDLNVLFETKDLHQEDKKQPEIGDPAARWRKAIRGVFVAISNLDNHNRSE